MNMMMQRQTTALAGIAILAGLVWRLELESHGWDGLDWIGYFHWAIPAGVVLFLGWLFAFAPIAGTIKRGALVLATAVSSVIWFLVAQFALFYHFNGGPGAFVNMLAVGEITYRIYANLVYAVVPLTPLMFAGILFFFGLKPKAFRVMTAVLVYVLACPISIVLLAVLNHSGEADALHTIKSGVIIPFLVAGLGLLIPKQGKAQHSDAP